MTEADLLAREPTLTPMSKQAADTAVNACAPRRDRRTNRPSFKIAKSRRDTVDYRLRPNRTSLRPSANLVARN